MPQRTSSHRTPNIEHQTFPKRLSLIAAMSENRVIGVDGGLPWKLPDEMAQFRAYTLGHAVIMGRVNFEVEGQPLPHRRNIVLTTQHDWAPPPLENKFPATTTLEVCHSLDEALTLIGDSDPEPFVIGGGVIYELALPLVDRMVLTTVHTQLQGDTFFPTFAPQDWQLTDQRHHQADPRHAHPFTVNTFDRVR